MELDTFNVERFRSIEQAEIRFGDLVSIIGPNNAGKSSIIRAIELFLGTKTPDIEDWPRGDTSRTIVFEACFREITEEERNKPGLAGLVYNDEIRVQATYSIVDGKVQSSLKCKKRPEEVQGWAEKLVDCDDYFKAIVTDLELNGTTFKSAANKERILKVIRENHADKITLGEETWTDDGVSIPQAIQQGLPRAEVIPAVADATQESLSKAGTAFQRILATAVLPAIESTAEYRALVDAAELLRTKLRGDSPVEEIEDVKESIARRVSELIPASIVLDMAAPDSKKYVGANVSLGLDDGGTTDIGRQGHGLQRALIFAMLDHLADSVDGGGETGRPVVLLFEEPELYVHPQLLRRYRDVLRAIGARANWQVVLTTHSPVMVDVGHDPTGLVILRRPSPSAAPSIHQPTEDPFGTDGDERERLRATLDFDPAAAEAFFASDAVLVEGDSEIALFQGGVDWHQVPGIELAPRGDLVVIGCGGKWTIPAFARVLTAFKIPFRILHDVDRKGLTDEELAEKSNLHPFKANTKIQFEIDAAAAVGVVAGRHEVEDTLEDLLWDGGAPHKKDKPFQAWKRAHYLEQHPEEISDGFREVLQFVFGSPPGDEEE